jgi:hypothetical protein
MFYCAQYSEQHKVYDRKEKFRSELRENVRPIQKPVTESVNSSKDPERKHVEIRFTGFRYDKKYRLQK